ncbi:hypothetical protein R5W24_000540 [Gemmata sp. JC717]|uniref:hypothetical protein n=1 Tax=Gemmata algarum TaxID=2975278 RepID=UPI0021BAF684|nr:hypothetical protein [Gemmata algarum]MDY3551464.1 hypothetical protein [Gemmata algarum]
MAKSRKKAAAPATEVTQPTEQPAAEVTPAEREAAHEHGHAHRENSHAARYAHIANPSTHRRPVRKLPGTMSLIAGDLTVRLIDKGDNLAGIGIQVVTPEGRTLSEEEKALVRKHVKGTEAEPSGFRWLGELEMWHKAILRDGEFEDQVPPSRPVAIRLDAERRVEALAEDLRRLHGQASGFVGAEEQRREMAAQGSGHSPA